MKICFFCDINNPHIVRWVNYFFDHGHEIVIVSFQDEAIYHFHEEIDIHLIKLVRIWGRASFKLTAILKFLKIKRIIYRLKIDLIHSFGFHHYGWTASFLKFDPIVISEWGNDVLFPKGKPFYANYLVRKAVQRATLIHFNGQKSKKALISDFFADTGKLFENFYGTNTEDFHPEKRSYKLREEILDNPLKDVMVITLRGLAGKIYDAETIINAIPLVIAKSTSTKFVFIGDGPMRKYLTNLVSTLNLENNVIFTGRLSFEKLPVYLASADIYVSVSLSDSGLAVSTAEAMASELPVVVSDDSDNRLWLEDNVNGFFVPTKSPKIVAEKLLYLISNEKARSDFGGRNREMIVKKKNFFTEMGKMEQAYKKLIEN